MVKMWNGKKFHFCRRTLYKEACEADKEENNSDDKRNNRKGIVTRHGELEKSR